MATYQLKDPTGKVISGTFNEADAASMKNMGLAKGYSLVPASSEKTTTTTTAKNGGTRNDVIDALASKGNEKAIAAKANNYTFPTKTTTPIDTTKTLPDDSKKSSLVEFADALNQATTLARARRQEGEMGILEQYGFKPGKVQAGTMGSILSLLETRGNTTDETLRTSALDAYKTEELNKRNEKANIQELALQLITKGVDQATIQGMLNMDSFDEAIKSAAGALKSTKEYNDIREVDGKLIGIKADGTYDTIYEGTGGTSSDFTPTQKLELEAAGLLNASRAEQVDYLFGKDNPENKKPDYVTAETFIRANGDASYETLRAGLLERADDLNFTATDVDAVLAKVGVTKDQIMLTDAQITTKAQDIAKALVVALDVDQAKAKIDSGTITSGGKTYRLTSSQKTILKNKVDAMYPNGKRTTTQKVLPGGA